MKSVLIKIEPSLLKWIKNYVMENFNNREILDELDTWNNANKPRFTDIERMSKRIHLPFGNFFLKEPPEESNIIVEFCTLNRSDSFKLSLELKETINKMKYIQSWMEEYLLEDNFKQLEYVGKGKNLNKIELANLARETLNIDEKWFGRFSNSYETFVALRNLFEDIGVLVMLNNMASNNSSSPLDLKEFRAFVLVSDLAPLVVINNEDNYETKIFAMLYEFIHILLGENDLFNNEQNYEQLCYIVAADLIVTDSLFNSTWNSDLSYKDNIEIISKRFNASLSMVTRRALELNKITKTEYVEFQNQISSQVQNRSKNYYKNQTSQLDSRLKEAITSSINNGELSYSDAFSMTDTNNSTFNEILNS